jgi:hypothetical protein
VFDISEEIRKLSEIKDIQDELQMIEDVVIQQTRALLTLDDVLNDNSRSTASSLANVQRLRRTINRYQKDARQAHDEVHYINPSQRYGNLANILSAIAYSATRFEAETGKCL